MISEVARECSLFISLSSGQLAATASADCSIKVSGLVCCSERKGERKKEGSRKVIIFCGLDNLFSCAWTGVGRGSYDLQDCSGSPARLTSRDPNTLRPCRCKIPVYLYTGGNMTFMMTTCTTVYWLRLSTCILVVI